MPCADDAKFTAIGVNGGVNNQGPSENDGIEANLDIPPFAVSMSYKTPINYYSTAGPSQLIPDLE